MRLFRLSDKDKMKRKRISSVYIILFLAGISVLSPAQDKPSEDLNLFISKIKDVLEAKDIHSYLELFSPEIRTLEKAKISSIFANFKMDTVSVYPVSISGEKKGAPEVYLRMFFENPYSAILELWQFSLIKGKNSWQVTNNEHLGESKRLFKLEIPSEKIERVKSFEFKHKDISIRFKDAVLFYDNIPGLETALIVTGKGEMTFSPSHPREQHQLELIYKNRILNDKLDYVYLRFSNSVFKKNARIIKKTDEVLPVTESDRKKAYSLFTKHYSRSFTVKNSLDNQLLSLLPKGDEAVIEFEGARLGDISYIYSPFSDDEINFYQWKEGRIISLYSPPLDKKQKRFFISFGQKFDVKNYEIDIDYKPEEMFFAGKAKIKIETKVGLLDGIKLMLNPEFEILRINDENNRELYYTRDDLRKIIYIYFLERPSRGQVSYMEVYYRGKLPCSVVKPEGKETDNIQKMKAAYNRLYDTYLYTRSDYWYPLTSDEDYFTARFKITVPPDYQAVSNGELVEKYHLQGLKDVEDVGKMGNSVFVFESKKPVKYLSFLVGKLTKIEEGTFSVPLRYSKASNSYPDKWDVFEGAGGILKFYVKIFGAFPYEKLWIIKRPWDTRGGSSLASFIVLNELLSLVSNPGLRQRTDNPVDLSRWKEYFLAHEIAHQWWGHGLDWNSYRDIWLSEGISQFAAILFLKEKYGDKVYNRILEKISGGVKKKSKWGGITMGSRISHFNYEAYQAIVYNKAALVLNMLKDLLGDELFFAGIKRFFSRHKYRTATTDAFMNVFHDISGKDLGLFFEKWFNSYKLPEVRASHSIITEEDGSILKFKFVQTKEQFVFPLWLEWRENGKKICKKIIINDRVVNCEFRVISKPGKIKINPDKAVPGTFHFK